MAKKKKSKTVVKVRRDLVGKYHVEIVKWSPSMALSREQRMQGRFLWRWVKSTNWQRQILGMFFIRLKRKAKIRNIFYSIYPEVRSLQREKRSQLSLTRNEVFSKWKERINGMVKDAYSLLRNGYLSASEVEKDEISFWKQIVNKRASGVDKLIAASVMLS